MKNETNPKLPVKKLSLPAPRRIYPDQFIRYRLTPDKKHLRSCGYDWDRAAECGYRRLEQQRQGSTRGVAFDPEDYESPPKREKDKPIEVPVGKPLLAYINTPPRPEDTLFGRRWLCRKGTAMLIGPSGLGKTALVLQGSSHWGAGLPFLGIEPQRPLKIAIFGCEDDEGDIHEIMRDACRELNLSAEQEALVSANVRYYHHTETSGLLFLRQIVEPVLARDKPDLVIINPLQGYLGGSIQDAALTGSFVRNTLLPILDKHNAAAIIVHHTPKTNYRNTEKWTFMDWQYSAQGGADLTNAMRAILVLEPTTKLGVFRLMGPKRGQRLGWEDDFGVSTRERFIAWKDPDSSSIWWRLATDDEIAGATEKPESSTRKAPADKALELVPEEGVDKQVLKQRIMARFKVSPRTADQVFNELFANDQIHEVPFKRTGKPPGKLVKRGPLPEQELLPVADDGDDETVPRKTTEEDALDVLRDGMKTQEWQKACYHERDINRTDFHTFKRSIVAKGLASQNGPEERWLRLNSDAASK